MVALVLREKSEVREKVNYEIPPTSGFLVCSEDLMQLFLTKQATINNNNNSRTINNNNSKNINSMTISNNHNRTINNNSRTITVGL